MLTLGGLPGSGEEGHDAGCVRKTYEAGNIVRIRACVQQVADTGAAEHMGRNEIAQSHLPAAIRQFSIDPAVADGFAPAGPEQQVAAGLAQRVSHVKPHEFDGLARERNRSLGFAGTQFKHRTAFRGGPEVVSNEPAYFDAFAARAVQNGDDRIELNLESVSCGKSDKHQTFIGSWDGFHPHPATIEPNDESPFKGINSYGRSAATPASRGRLFTRFGNLVEQSTGLPVAGERGPGPKAADNLWTPPGKPRAISTSQSTNDGRITAVDSNGCGTPDAALMFGIK